MGDGYYIEFHFGTRKIKERKVYLAALFLNLGVNIIHRFTKTPHIELWAIIDEIGRHYKIKIINEIILRSPELLEHRVERDTKKAIDDYKTVVESKEPPVMPIFTEVKEGETALGGELRLRGNWVEE